MTTPEFAPSTNRGTALLHEIMALVEAEVAAEAQAQQQMTDWLASYSSARHWDQGDWLQANLGAVSDSVNLVALATADLGLPDATALADYEGEFVHIDLPPTVRNLCGTAGCFAGHAVMAVGDMPHLSALVGDILGHERIDVSMHQVTTYDTGDTLMVEDRAADLLGIDTTTADVLFNASNTLADLRAIVETIDRHGNIDEIRDMCADCGEWKWRCAFDAETCPECDEHEVDCTCSAYECPECGTGHDGDSGTERCQDCQTEAEGSSDD
ncbi:hypothetical protein SEA_YAGO84_73 [Gordonia phage Yago84]|nr:hypothetical protein SEA_YAGO84_73 [Gordonia phage Yago84]WIC90056.1 hypothetical protein SEA_SISKO_74 [Gordonia phage Sisko]